MEMIETSCRDMIRLPRHYNGQSIFLDVILIYNLACKKRWMDFSVSFTKIFVSFIADLVETVMNLACQKCLCILSLPDMRDAEILPEVRK